MAWSQGERMFGAASDRSFTESINRENKINDEWHVKHDDCDLKRGVDCCSWDDEPNVDDGVEPKEDLTKGGLQRFPPVESNESKDWKSMEQSLQDEEKDVKPYASMRAVSVGSKMKVFEGSNHDGGGADNYLKFRNISSPESKYDTPICSSWDYGWTDGHTQKLECPKFGRRREIMKASFFKKNDDPLKPKDWESTY